MEFLDRFENGVAPADNGDTIHVALPLVGIVVDDADHPLPNLRYLVDIPENHTACCTCTDQHDTAGRRFSTFLCFLAHQ